MSPYDPLTARVGDWISRPTDLPSFTLKPRTHHGVVVVIEDGVAHVVDLTLNDGYRVITYAEFAGGRPVTLVAKGVAGEEQAVFDRAIRTMERAWGWKLTWTCEHVAAFIHDGKSRGTQGTDEMVAISDLTQGLMERLLGKR